MSDQQTQQPRRKLSNLPTTVKVALITGAFSIITIIMTGVFSYITAVTVAQIPIRATQTAEAGLSAPTGEPIPTPAIVRSESVAIRTYHNTYITAVNDKPGWNWELLAETETVSAWEKFTLHYLDNGKVVLETYHGRFVTATDGTGCCNMLRAATLERGKTEEFTLEQVGDDKVAFKASCGYYVSAGDAGWYWFLRIETASLGEWERFELISQ